MTREARFFRKALLILLLVCASIAAADSSDNGRERRHVGLEESNQRPDRIRTSGSRSSKSPAGKNNEITAAEPGRKVSHRLIGGHLRVDARKERNEGESAAAAGLWDDGILMSSAGGGKEGSGKRTDEDDEKKTLSQQVKEGKYGLIQNEIYAKRPKRPGILSYLGNPEVPKDTAENLGGLDEEEIWLAENHVLVLRGGKFPGHENGQRADVDVDGKTWPPIDDYVAPRRQVKIPARPKIPPPFPIQLKDGGPVQIFGPNGTVEIANGSVDYNNADLYPKEILPPAEGPPFFAVAANGTILTPNLGPAKNVTGRNKSANPEQKSEVEPPPPPGEAPPFYHAIPPGAVFVPPPNGNQSDYDEEDQSIYYPPPYSFQYPQDNTTAVPPGPLVPGIILPPPPDFFSALEEKSTTNKYSKRPVTTPMPRPRPTYLPPRKLATKRYKPSTVPPTTVTKVSVTSSVTAKSRNQTMCRNTTNPVLRNQAKTAFEARPLVQVTTLAPSTDKPTTLENTELFGITPVVGNQVSETSTEHKSRGTSGVLNRKIPVLAYFPTTTSSSLERPIEVTPASIKNIITTGQPGRVSNQASYYFYEESTDETAGTTVNPSLYYRTTTTETPFYKIEGEPIRAEPKGEFYVEAIPSSQVSKDYSVKLIDSLLKDPQIYRYSDSGTAVSSSTKFDSGSARTTGQRMLSDQPAVYYQTISDVSPIGIQSYYGTPKPETYYQQEPRNRYGYATGSPATKSKPIYQYSFEAADYAKRGGSRKPYYKHHHQQQQQQQQQATYEYSDGKTTDHRYDYDDGTTGTQQRLRSENIPYKIRQPVYSTTDRPIVQVTQNPHHAYFTRQDEKLLDDVTKEYFTIFGKKLPEKGIQSTTPIYGKAIGATEKPSYSVNTYIPSNYNTDSTATYKTPDVQVHYGDRPSGPYSLKDDVLVNYKNPLPPVNPDSEFITIVEPKRPQQQSALQNYRVQPDRYILRNPENQRPAPIRGAGSSQRLLEQTERPASNYVRLTESREELQETYPQRPIPLEDDIAVNYRHPRPPLNPDAEFVEPISGDNRPDKANAYFAYRFPGDGGHFYFLTPQAVTRRQDRSGRYLYPEPKNSRESRVLKRRWGSTTA